jgi:RNA polymerase sigma-70 factor (ECF subfamily)
LEELQSPGLESPPEGRSERLDTQDALMVRRALASLPPDQKQALLMAFFEGKTHLEIAESLGEPLGTIKARIRRAMLKLRDSLQEYA